MLRWLCVNCLVGLSMLLAAEPARAQFLDAPADRGPNLSRSATQRLKIGVQAKAGGGSLQKAMAWTLVPAEWPEQKVQIVREEASPTVQITYRNLTGGGLARLMFVEAPFVAAGQEIKAYVTFEVTRSATKPPGDTAQYKIPKRLDRDLTLNVGAGPYIETRHAKIVSAAREAVADAENDWAKVLAIYDYVRDNIVQKSGELKGAARTLADKHGDVDDLVSLFVAMCRAQKIPARTVFELQHVYAEFCLEDEDGKGHWFPCQPAGMRAFGGVDDMRPILQKGDNFKVPERGSDRERFVTEFFKASIRGKDPSVSFMCEIVGE